MSAVFLKVLNLSITAGWLILAVLLVRLLLKRAPKWITCVLWALVAVRLVCPFSLESVLSLIPSRETVPDRIETMERPTIDSGIVIVDNAVNPVIEHHLSPRPDASANPLQIIVPVLAAVWIAGMVTLLLHAWISYLRLKKSVGACVPVKDRILACDDVQSPFILGIFRPAIYVPSSMTGETLACVINHETAHIRRHDHWWKPLGYLLLAVYWFSPLCWLAYVLLCRDIEMACDEKVIRELDHDDKAAYSQALLNASFPRRRIAACPLAFGEVGVKERVKSVLNYKKPAFWIIIAAVVLCIAVAVCFMTDPFSGKKLDVRLKISMDMAVAEHYRFDKTDNRFHTMDYEVLGVSNGDGTTTVYAWVLYQRYRFDGTDIHCEPIADIPTAVTFDTTPKGDVSSYEAIEYWEPRDGYYYTEDIQSKFPRSLWEKAYQNAHVKRQAANCQKAAEAYFKSMDTPRAAATKWFDRLTGDDIPWNDVREITLDEFPGVTFRCDADKLEAVTADEALTLYNGMPICNVYFCDLNGDGKRELCATACYGSGIVDTRIYAADYANGVLHELNGRDEGHDYHLVCKDGQLWGEETENLKNDVIMTGPLALPTDGGANSAAIYLTQHWSYNKSGEILYGNADAGQETTVCFYESAVFEAQIDTAAGTGITALLGEERAAALAEIVADVKEWTDDALVDRTAFCYNGYFMLAGDKERYYFSYWNRVLYHGHHFAELDDGQVQILKDLEAACTDYRATEYVFHESVDPMKPTIRLSKKEETFQFSYSAFSCCFAIGRYELTDEELILRTDDGVNTYVFRVSGDTLVFDASRSSAIPEFAYASGAEPQSPVPDGAVFRK